MYLDLLQLKITVYPKLYIVTQKPALAVCLTRMELSLYIVPFRVVPTNHWWQLNDLVDRLISVDINGNDQLSAVYTSANRASRVQEYYFSSTLIIYFGR